MTDWFEGRLADACASIDYGLTASAALTPVGPKFLRITDIVGGSLDWDSVPFVETDDQSTQKYRLNHLDIVIARTGATTGVSRFISDPPTAVFASYLVRLSIKPNFDPRFIGYWLKSPAFWGYLKGVLGDKSAQPNASASTMTNAPMRVPAALAEQRAIAATLGALDDKIELNRKMNATLEAMARALFRDWFVDFGPTRAKMEARAPYLSPDLWSLFPDRLDDEGKPEGWAASTIGDEVRVAGGSTPSTKEPDLWDGGINWATPKDLSTLAAPVLLETSRTITEAGLAKISSGLLPVGALLLSSRAPIGYLAIAEVPVAINQGFIGMICDKRVSNVFAWLWTLENMEAILAKANGSTFQEISKGNFRPLPVVVPSEPVLRAFDAVVKPLYDRIANNERESRSLAQTRDLLLPRLMSGQLQLHPDAMAG